MDSLNPPTSQPSPWGGPPPPLTPPPPPQTTAANAAMPLQYRGGGTAVICTWVFVVSLAGIVIDSILRWFKNPCLLQCYGHVYPSSGTNVLSYTEVLAIGGLVLLISIWAPITARLRKAWVLTTLVAIATSIALTASGFDIWPDASSFVSKPSFLGLMLVSSIGFATFHIKYEG